ncbi:MAG: ABC transporter ATP-binding protein [Firmicutes bacterium]|nr:ABC transporter ATP-binding protein [Bacillota bacterium]
MHETPALQVKAMSKTYRERRRPGVRAVDNVSFSVKQNEVVGLLGPNGAGKTTIIKCILGLMQPDSGEISVLGQDVQANYPRVLRNMSAVLEGSRNLYWRLTVWENILFFAGLNGVSPRENHDYFQYLIQRFSLEDQKDVQLRKLSQGMKQKAALICALARRTPVVFLDEPTLGLDVETSIELRRILKQLAQQENRTIVVSSHDMDVIQDICQRVIILSSGRIIVDDQVSHLMKLFDTRSYRIALDGSIPEGLEEALTSHFTSVNLAANETGVELTIDLPERDDIYLLMDMLRNTGAVIDHISHADIDLERVFLEVVRRERDNDESRQFGHSL